MKTSCNLTHMSIIYDALKKIQKSNAVDLNYNLDNKEKNYKYRMYFFYSSMVCIGLFIGYIFFSFLSRPKYPATKQTAKVSVQENTPLPIEKPPVTTNPVVFTAPEKKPRDPPVLNGIFFSQDEGYALINNQIVKEGDLIAGGRVKRITLDEVRLEYDGREITVPAKK